MEQRQVHDPAPNGNVPAERAALAKAKAEAKEAKERVRAEEKARQKSEAALAKTQETLAAVRKELVKARRALAAKEATLAEMRDRVESAHAGSPAAGEALASAPEGDSGERRVSFVVRLAVDGRGHVRRSEVEHAQSGKKEVFPTLDAARLISFMAANSAPANGQDSGDTAGEETIAPPVPAAATTPSAHLAIREATVSRPDMPQVRALAVAAHTPFVWRASVEVEGAAAEKMLAEKPAFELRLYASNVRGGRAQLLATETGKLAGPAARMEMCAPGLAPGLYRLVALALCEPPLALSCYQEGPVVDVVGSREAMPAGGVPAGA